MDLILQKEIKNFSDVRKYLCGIPHINDGGCGISALVMYRWLEKNQQKKPNLIACYDSDSIKNYNLNRQSFESGEFNFIAPDHCGIEYQNLLMDADWFIQQVMYAEIQTIDEEKMLFLINFGEDWNPKFDRKNVKRIGKDLEIKVSDIISSNWRPKNP